jgi:hypothetical protein
MEFSSVAAMMAACPVSKRGGLRVPPRLSALVFDVANCNIKIASY